LGLRVGPLFLSLFFSFPLLNLNFSYEVTTGLLAIMLIFISNLICAFLGNSFRFVSFYTTSHLAFWLLFKLIH
jgi:hypothetical protein